jgi:hypothetical protein
MTTDKDFKRLVRSRMRKTGESYTAARSQLLTKPSPPVPADYATLAGLSDAAIKAGTGCTWERWVKVLDKARAYEWQHREIARHVYENYKISGWWSQGVTTGYERIKGLRAIGQRRGGDFEAAKSKTFAAPLTRLYRAWSVARTRARWLPGVDLKIRSAIRNKSMRITWPDGTSVHLYFAAKGTGKSQVAIQHVKLADRSAQTRMKEFWGERLAGLEDVLVEGRGSKV